MIKDHNFEPLHSLITFDNFKVLIGIDDREEKQARFCLTTATLNIEQYCKRSFLRKQYFETIKFTGNLIIPLKEYPVTEILTVYTYNEAQLILTNGDVLEPEFYRPMLGNDYNTELPFELLLSASLKPYRISAIKVNYLAGYVVNPHPCGFTTRSFCDAKTSAKAMETAASGACRKPNYRNATLRHFYLLYCYKLLNFDSIEY